MAIYHTSIKSSSRGKGHSSVAKIAYVTASVIRDERTGVLHDYRRRQGVAFYQMVYPEGVNKNWTLSQFWNEAEKAEKKINARTATEYEISLPHELSNEERLSLAQAIVKEIVNEFQVGATYALHHPTDKNDRRNYHMHLVTSTRIITNEGFTDKAVFEYSNTRALKEGRPIRQQRVKTIRSMVAEKINFALMSAGLEERVTHKSFLNQKLELQPMLYKGKADALYHKGIITDRYLEYESRNNENLLEIAANPEVLLQKLTVKKQVFTKEELAEELLSYVNVPLLQEREQETPRKGFLGKFVQLFKTEQNRGNEISYRVPDKLMYKSLVIDLLEGKQLQERDLPGNFAEIKAAAASLGQYSQLVEIGKDWQEQIRLTTLEVLNKEQRLQDLAAELQENKEQEVKAIEESGTLSAEQLRAANYLLQSKGIACVVGKAGAGKSTMIKPAYEEWIKEGYNVKGLSISGIAAFNLQKSTGIESNTIASFLLKNVDVNDKTVLVVDEAGMVDSDNMIKLLEVAANAKAKIILVGDYDQLQPVSKGSPFKTLCRKVGQVELTQVFRQNRIEHRQATEYFAQHKVKEALDIYSDNLHFTDNPINEIAASYLEKKDSGTVLVLAQQNKDVEVLNQKLRQQLELGEKRMMLHKVQGKLKTSEFAINDRIVFLKNNSKLGVVNGMTGTITQLGAFQTTVRTDSGKEVKFDSSYKEFDYGYALTVHRAQGVTVDHCLFYAEGFPDWNLANVAISRHRETLEIFRQNRTGLKKETQKQHFVEQISRRITRNDAGDFQDLVDDFNSSRNLVSLTGAADKAERELAEKRKLSSNDCNLIAAYLEKRKKGEEVEIPERFLTGVNQTYQSANLSTKEREAIYTKAAKGEVTGKDLLKVLQDMAQARAEQNWEKRFERKEEITRGLGL